MSKVIDHVYFYKTSLNFTPNLVNLSLLYQPIIGNDAYLLYNEMFNDSKINSLSIDNKRSLYDLFKKIGFDSQSFHKNRKILEAVNLISTYFDNSNENEIKYFFILNNPLEFEHFFSNSKFKKLLSLKLPSKKFEELEFIFEKVKIPLFAKNISVNFNEIFKNQINIEYDFDFDEIYSRISQLTSINVIFSKNSKNIINSFYKNFSLTINEIEKCILNSIVNKDNEFILDEVLLNSELVNLTNKSNDINFFEILNLNRSNLIFTNEIEKDELNKIFLDYKNIKSEQYLVSIQKQQLNMNEINSLKTIRRDMYLPDSIINVILDFSLRKTYGNLNIKYIKKVAKTISILNLDSVESVYDHLLKSISFSKKNNLNKLNLDINNTNDDLNIVDIII